ncbi:SIS domain-containing protein [Paraburkholderia sp. RP-4-7]|jgi:fructoselysine 6-phosphate deglycase|uniref:SIS domain-containing protein n=1 Tax=Paraburkholderia polaris TaxID=2728848 RepID=A0A848IFT8_9BURK|nr:SIS domain-containing protein [Paraburkholderia polaris]NML99068.1 SIS domain-containing protein [Paraburkholderia polaris]
MNDATSLLHADVERALNGLTDKKIDHVFFVACGGSLSVMYPGKFLLDSYSRKLASDCLNADEFVQRDPVILGSTSLVILCSMTGTTKETLRAAQHAKAKGAVTVGLSVDTLSPLAQEVDFPIGFEAPYTTGVPIDARDSNYARLYQLVMGLVKAHDGIDKLAPLVASLNNLQPAIDRAHATFEPLFTQYAGQLHGESVIYTLASGASYGAAYSFSICVLMEMLWINSQAVHAGEFFHGPFEVLDRDRAFVLLMGLDRTRPQQERAKVFLERFGSPEKIMVLDAAKLDLDGIDDEFKGNLVPLIFFDTLWKFAYKMANLRNHVMLEGRRYMKKISY